MKKQGLNDRKFKIYFYTSERGQKNVRIFLRELPPKHRVKCIEYLNRLRQHGKNLPKNIISHLEKELWEVRPEYGGIEYRFLFFFHRDIKIGVATALVKKKQRLDRSIIERGLRLIEEMRAEWQEQEK